MQRTLQNSTLFAAMASCQRLRRVLEIVDMQLKAKAYLLCQKEL